MNSINIAYILFGLILLFFGRVFFWVFVAVMGFFYGATIAAASNPEVGSAWFNWLIAAGGGLLGALFAIFFQEIAVLLGGFMAGAYVLTYFLKGSLMGQETFFYWAAFLAGGLAGAAAMFFLYDWALIILSALAGAALILSGVELDITTKATVAALAVLIGIVVQARAWFETDPHLNRN